MYQRFLLKSLDVAHPSIQLSLPQVGPENVDIVDGYGGSPFDLTRLVVSYTSTVRSHLLLHAGVLAQNGQGILIVAPSMHGKTTLTLELLRRGFGFLSDEIAALSLADEQIHPFPRSLVIRSGSLEMAGFGQLPTNLAASKPTWLGKQIIDAETLRPGSLHSTVPIRHIFFLHDDQPYESQSKRMQCEVALRSEKPSCGLLLSSLSPALLRTIEDVDGLDSLTVGELDNQPYLTIYAQDRPTVLQRIEVLCHKYQTDLMHLGYRPLHCPTFDGPVTLSCLSQGDAILLLLQQFLGGYHSALLQNEFGNSPVRLSMMLARIIRHANCYRLRVGPLQEMADTIGEVVDGERWRLRCTVS